MIMMIKQERGFSLVELLTAMTVTAFLLGAIYMAVNTTQRDSTSIERKVVVQADAKSALDVMALEISMASYMANFIANAWVNPANCTAIAANQNLRGIQTATGSTIVVQMDADDSCKAISPPANCIGDGPNEIISYTYVTTAGPEGERYITRAVSCAPPQAFLGDLITSGNPRNVRVNNVDLNIPLFRYFDGSNNELIPAPAPLTGTARRLDNTTIPDIRRILITLALQTAEIDPFRGERRQLFYSTSVIPRNHAIQ